MCSSIRKAQGTGNGIRHTLFIPPTTEISFQIFNGRKTDQCGVILFGSDGIASVEQLLFLQLKSLLETKNIINAENGGYENVLEYIPIAQANASTLAKIDSLQPSASSGDRMVSLICLHTFEVISLFSHRCTRRWY